MKEMKVKITFTESVLGTCPNNEEIYAEYIASKAPDAMSREEEIAALGDDVVAEKGTTVFPRDNDGTPLFWNYQIEGFFKGACGFLRAVKDTKSSAVKAYKRMIDGRIFVFGEKGEDNPTGRKIRINNAFPIGLLQRSLRASTAQGDRIPLACSEEIPAGAWAVFKVVCLVDDDMELVKEWLDYGELNGIGQWRNAGHGRIVWDELDENGNVIGGNNEYIKGA